MIDFTFGHVAAISIFVMLMSIIAIAALCKNTKARYRCAFVVGHTLFVVCVGLFGFPVRDDGQVQLLWLIPALVDLPIVPIILLIKLLVLEIDLSVYTALLLLFILIGGALFYVYGWLLDVILEKTRQQGSGSMKGG